MYSIIASFLVLAGVASLTVAKPSSVVEVPKQDNTVHTIQRRNADTYREVLKTLIPELVERLAELPPSYDSSSDVIKQEKRKAFWQPMSGPLPVETRLASFGSRIEANQGSPKINPNILKAMRYGK